MKTDECPTVVSDETAVTVEVRADQQNPRPRERRWLIADVCLCGGLLPHEDACPWSLDPEICS